MFGFHAVLRCINVFFLIPYVSGEQSKTLKGSLRSDVENHAEFIEHVHSFLDISPVGSIKVHDSMACTLHCLRNEQCYSVNFAVDFDDQGHDCDLLPSDKYNSPNKFEKNVAFHHYSIASPCENDPCKKGAKCLPLYRSNGFLCKGFQRKIGRAVPWLNVADNICFGAKGNSYAKFTFPWSGAVLSVKLVHVSGHIKCQQHKRGSYWGCHSPKRFTTYITNEKDEVIFPDYHGQVSYDLSGYHVNSTEVVFRVLKPSVRVAAGEEFRIWHRQDLLDSSEGNNDGKTCTDVYILIT